VYYSTGPASLTMFASASEMRHAKVFWTGAWVLLDAAGALFAAYILVMVTLLLIGSAERFRARRTDR
jgi:hypothetical protein